MKIRHSLIALGALTLPAVTFGQAYWPPMPVPQAPPPPPPAAQAPMRAPVAEPWMARPMPAQVPSGEPWQSPIAQSNKGPALEPIDLPPAIEQGVDMIYIDEALVPRAVQQNGFLAGMSNAAWSAAPVDLFTSVNPIYTDLRRGLVKYEQSWGSLPQLQIPAGPTLKSGSTGDRVSMLRTRLGLGDGGSYDAAVAAKVKDFQGVHGLKADGISDARSVDFLFVRKGDGVT